MVTTSADTPLRRPVGVALGLAAVWVMVAAWRPETTYHLARLLVAGVPPVVFVLDVPPTRAVHVVGAAGLGLAIALSASAALSAVGWLAGPPLLPTGGAVAEAVVFSGVGVVAGVLVALVLRSRAGSEG